MRITRFWVECRLQAGNTKLWLTNNKGHNLLLKKTTGKGRGHLSLARRTKKPLAMNIGYPSIEGRTACEWVLCEYFFEWMHSTLHKITSYKCVILFKFIIKWMARNADADKSFDSSSDFAYFWNVVRIWRKQLCCRVYIIPQNIQISIAAQKNWNVHAECESSHAVTFMYITYHQL